MELNCNAVVWGKQEAVFLLIFKQNNVTFVFCTKMDFQGVVRAKSEGSSQDYMKMFSCQYILLKIFPLVEYC